MKKLIKKLKERFDEKQLLIGEDVKALEPDWFGDLCSAFAVRVHGRSSARMRAN